MARKATCLKPKDCRVTVARLDFNAARGCSAKQAAAEEFRKVAAKAARVTSKAEKTKLFKEALRKIASAHRACGNESAARSVLEAERRRIVDEQPMDGLSGTRRRKKRRR
jgi:hypothetical protein